MNDAVPPDKVRISLNGEFSGPELEEIIRGLAEARAGLEPSVSQEPPTTLDAQVLVQEDALFKFRTLTHGGLRIWLRNEGLGWLAFSLTAADVAGIQVFLNEKLGHTHTSQ